MMLFGSGECGCPERWPYSWITTVQNFGQSKSIVVLNWIEQSPLRSGLLYDETGFVHVEVALICGASCVHEIATCPWQASMPQCALASPCAVDSGAEPTAKAWLGLATSSAAA